MFAGTSLFALEMRGVYDIYIYIERERERQRERDRERERYIERDIHMYVMIHLYIYIYIYIYIVAALRRRPSGSPPPHRTSLWPAGTICLMIITIILMLFNS